MSEIDATNTISRDYLYFDDQPLVLVKHAQQPQTDSYLLMGADNAIPPGSLSVLASISNQTLEITRNDGQKLQVTLSYSQWKTSVNTTHNIHTLSYSDATGLNISGMITTNHIDNHSTAELTIAQLLEYQFTQDYRVSGIVTQLPGVQTHYTVIPFDGLVIIAARPIESTLINIDINTKTVHVTYADGNSQDFQIAASDWVVSLVDQNTRYDFSYQQGNNQLSGYLLQGVNETKASIDVQAKDDSNISYSLPEQPNGLDLGEFYYYHNDHLGTPQLLTDREQAIVWEGHYSPFGEVQISTSIVENNIRFAGQYFDSENGLHYNYFRYYDPNLGRYITSDPIGLEGGLNTYAYVGGNPIIYVDKFGLFQFGSRPLDGMPYQDSPQNDGNTTLSHEHGFYDNGRDVGYFPTGIDPDNPANINKYERFGSFLDDNIMSQAEQNVKNSGNWNPDNPNEPWYNNSDPTDYDLILHNCQDFADALRDEYNKLGGTQCNAPVVNNKCPLIPSP